MQAIAQPKEFVLTTIGGDPSKVTIWGGSAGGGSVTYQLMAGGGYDLPPFSGAIAEYRKCCIRCLLYNES